MSPVTHAVISAGAGAGLGFWLESWPAGIACFLSGVFIDIDHHLDCWILQRKIPLTYRGLMDVLDAGTTKKVYLFLHSYELLLLYWIAVSYFHLGNVWIGMGVGATVHMICDDIYNPFKPCAYFLICRIQRGFRRDLLFKEGYYP